MKGGRESQSCPGALPHRVPRAVPGCGHASWRPGRDWITGPSLHRPGAPGPGDGSFGRYIMSGFASGLKGLFGKKPKPAPVITMAGPDPENAQNEVVFAGHGAYNPEVDGRYNGGRVRLPVGVTIYFWCR